MPIRQPFYLNANNLYSSTAVFLDAALTMCAPDGFYSDGTIVRQQVGCVLLPQQNCTTCSVPCGTNINANGNKGLYLVNLDAGNSIGAVIVRFDPQEIPDGIRAIFNSNTYNKLSSPVDGLHKSTNANNYTFIGKTSRDCGISGNTYSLVEKLYNGTAFVDTGGTQSVIVAAGDVSLGANAPGNCMMVIPKPTTSPSIINLQMAGPCTGTAWTMGVACPVLLTGFSSTSVFGSSTLACAAGKNQTYYNASLDNTPGIVDVFDFVYSDNIGANQLTDGFYASNSIAGGAQWFQVTSGVVVAVGSCAVPCGSPIVSNISTGSTIYNVDLSTGTATGAIIITFDPVGIPDGILATLNSIQYNKLSSPNVGVLQSSVAGPTFIGQTTQTTGCTAWYPSGGTVNLTTWNWNGTVFVNSGIVTPTTIVAGQIKATTALPGVCVMVIPKTSASNLVLNVKVFGPCTSTGWNLTVPCPVALPSFMGSVRSSTANIPCTTAMTQTYYFVKVHITADTFVGVDDYVFTDVNGEFPLTDGHYLISNVAVPNKVIHVVNGIVTEITACT